MLKRRPQGSGAVQLGGEQSDHTRSHPKLQATQTMAQRLDLLPWSRKVGGARHGDDQRSGRIPALDRLLEEIARAKLGQATTQDGDLAPETERRTAP